MKRVKKPKPNKVTLTAKEIVKLKQEITDIAIGTSSLLYLTAMKDEFGFGYEEVKRVFVRAERYAKYLDGHMATMEDLAKTLEKDTGIKIKWR